MNSYQRVKTVLDGSIPDRIPVNLLNFICACKGAGYDLSECFTDGHKLARSQLLAFNDFGHDMMHLQTGVTSLAQILGCEIEFFKDRCPHVKSRVIKKLTGYKKLDIPDFTKPGSLVYELIRATCLISEKIKGKAFLRVESDQGPFSLAAILTGLDEFLMALTKPESFYEINGLIDFCEKVILEETKKIISAGADMVSFGDSFLSCDVCPPGYYKKFGSEHHKLMAGFIRKSGCYSALHNCGNTGPIISEMASTGFSAVEIDYKTDMETAKAAASGKTAIIGNIDPSNIMYFGTEEDVYNAARKAIEILGANGGFILGPGCDLPYDTPAGNIFALIESAKKYGRY